MATAESDRGLLRAYVDAGDEAAFEELFRRHEQGVRSAASRVCAGDRHLVDEAVQEVLLLFAAKAVEIRDAQALPAWLQRSARFVALRLRDREARRRRRQVPVDEAGDALPDGADDDRVALLRRHLEELPPAQREPIELCYLHGLGRVALARRLGISMQAAHKRVQRALRELRARMRSTDPAAELQVVALLGEWRPDLAIAAPGAAASTTKGWLLAAVMLATVSGAGAVLLRDPPPLPPVAVVADRPPAGPLVPPPPPLAILGDGPFTAAGRITAMAFAPDRPLLAIAGGGTVRCWDVPERRLVGTIEASEIAERCHGSVLADGPMLRPGQVASVEIRRLGFLADGRLLMETEADLYPHSVSVWQLGDDGPAWMLGGPVSVDRSGDLAVWPTDPGCEILARDGQRWRRTAVLAAPAEETMVGASFDPDDALLLTMHVVPWDMPAKRPRKDVVRLWRWRDGHELGRWECQTRGFDLGLLDHTSATLRLSRGPAVSWLADGAVLLGPVERGRQQRTLLVDPQSGVILREYPAAAAATSAGIIVRGRGGIEAHRRGAAPETLWAATDDPTVADAGDGRLAFGGPETFVATGDGRWVAHVQRPFTFVPEILDLEARRRAAPGDDQLLWTHLARTDRHPDGSGNWTFRGDGRIVHDDCHKLQVLDESTGRRLVAVHDAKVRLDFAEFSPDGTYAAVPTEGGIGIIDTRSGRQQRVLPRRGRGAFLDDRHLLIQDDAGLVVVDAEGGDERFRATGKHLAVGFVEGDRLLIERDPDGGGAAVVDLRTGARLPITDGAVRCWAVSRSRPLDAGRAYAVVRRDASGGGVGGIIDLHSGRIVTHLPLLQDAGMDAHGRVVAQDGIYDPRSGHLIAPLPHVAVAAWGPFRSWRAEADHGALVLRDCHSGDVLWRYDLADAVAARIVRIDVHPAGDRVALALEGETKIVVVGLFPSLPEAGGGEAAGVDDVLVLDRIDDRVQVLLAADADVDRALIGAADGGGVEAARAAHLLEWRIRTGRADAGLLAGLGAAQSRVGALCLRLQAAAKCMALRTEVGMKVPPDDEREPGARGF